MIRIEALGLTAALALLAGALTGCDREEATPGEPGTKMGMFTEIHRMGTTKVDLLFVVDSSNGMAEAQRTLSNQLQAMVRELVGPGARDDGFPPPPLRDLHIAVVSADLGAGGYEVPTCDGSDDGVMQNLGRFDECDETYDAPDCDDESCPWLVHSCEHLDDGTDPEDPPIWDDFGCIGTLGVTGCGYEQPLESALRALTTQSEPGGPNAGFLREDSLLGIIFITDEDDCSAADPALFDPLREDLGSPNVRCATHDELLHPVSRYREGLLELRAGREDLVVVAAIAGIPIDGSWNPGDSIEELRELERLNPDQPTELLPSCHTGTAYATPPVRLAELVYSFGNNGILHSICNSDWTPALQAITRKIQVRLVGYCLPRPFPPDSIESCRVVETLIDDRPCPHPAEPEGSGRDRTSGWQIDLGLDAAGHRQCEILPADYDNDAFPDGGCERPEAPEPGETGCWRHYDGCLRGWYIAGYDLCEYGQVFFTGEDLLSDRSNVRVECREQLCPEARRAVATARDAAPCDPWNPGSCSDGEVCVRHNGPALCGDDVLSCGRCSPTLSATCPAALEHPDHWSDDPLIGPGGCCHEGFHADATTGTCIADRTTRCE